MRELRSSAAGVTGGAAGGPRLSIGTSLSGTGAGVLGREAEAPGVGVLLRDCGGVKRDKGVDVDDSLDRPKTTGGFGLLLLVDPAGSLMMLMRGRFLLGSGVPSDGLFAPCCDEILPSLAEFVPEASGEARLEALPERGAADGTDSA